jgi:hypothetical protein
MVVMVVMVVTTLVVIEPDFLMLGEGNGPSTGGKCNAKTTQLPHRGAAGLSHRT